MKVKKLIELLKQCNQEKEVYFDSYSEGILFDITNINKEDIHYLTKEEIVTIKE